MNFTPFFSIIVPVYNVEQYIEQCIQSCLDQTFKNFEIIIVDDCSTDKSMTLIKLYHDNRIRILKNECNKGLFYSRIFGEQHGRGKYFLCLDSDDFLDRKLLEILHKIILEKNNLDAITFRSKTIPSYKHIYHFSKNQQFNMHNFYSWGKCYKKDLILKMHTFFHTDFPLISNSEDVLRSLVLYSFSRQYVHIDYTGYFYRIRKNSITHQKKTKSNCLDILKNIREIGKQKYSIFPLQNQALQILKSAYWIEKRYLKNYLYCCLRAFLHYPRTKTFLRALIYLFSLGIKKI